MLHGKVLYRCDGCELELHLLAPVERPCPNCGGSFVAIDKEAPINLVTRVPKRETSRAQRIDALVEREAPVLIAELEEFVTLLRQEAENGEEEGSSSRV